MINSLEMTEQENSPVNLESPIASLQSGITPTRSFYVRSHFPTPKIDANKWCLTVESDQEQKASWQFGLEDLKQMPQTAVTATLECAGNSRRLFQEQAKGEIQWGEGAVGTAVWSGVHLRHLLRNECKISFNPESQWKAIIFVGADGDPAAKEAGPDENPRKFARYLGIEKALHDDDQVVIATHMNGDPLSLEHGFPARLIVPGWYGMASVKWLSKIVLSRDEPRTYFNDVRYVYQWKGEKGRDPVAQLLVKSLITHPLNGEEIRLGQAVTITGKAWSGSGKIAFVDVCEEGGEDSWVWAELGEQLSQFGWVSWKKVWKPAKKGRFTIMSRAMDSRGNVQPERPLQNDYLYGYNAVGRVTLNVV